MKTRIFIDETGNTGSVSINGVKQQPLFALGAVTISDEFLEKLKGIEKTFRKRKRLQQQELKSSNTYDTQIEFTEAILSTFISDRIPMWFEVTDKKYYIICNLVTFTLLQVWVTRNLDKDHHHMMNVLVDYIDSNFHLEELSPYLIACQFPTRENLLRFLTYFNEVVSDRPKSEEKEAIQYAIAQLIPEINDENDPFEVKHYFPLPDHTKSGKLLAMLPYVQSFSNIFARINNWSKSRPDVNVEITHDEQMQFDDIIRDYRDFCENDIKHEWVNTKLFSSADYKFEQNYNLNFADSKSEKALQYADLAVGFLGRAVWQKLTKTISGKYSNVLRGFLKLPIEISTGTNFVMSNKSFEKVIKF